RDDGWPRGILPMSTIYGGGPVGSVTSMMPPRPVPESARFCGVLVALAESICAIVALSPCEVGANWIVTIAVPPAGISHGKVVLHSSADQWLPFALGNVIATLDMVVPPMFVRPTISWCVAPTRTSPNGLIGPTISTGRDAVAVQFTVVVSVSVPPVAYTVSVA